VQDRNTEHARATLHDASRIEREATAASRWHAGYLVLMGIAAFALVLAVEVVFPSGGARNYAIAGWGLAVILLTWWAETHDVHPRGAGRRVLIATAVWFGTYLVAIGPVVRWRAGSSLGWWTLAAAVLASPFLLAAWRERRRS
jgi:hypothetical protein